MSGDLQWNETGDRYMLKLFRDYIFHQVTPNGQPWIDLSHIVQCLNKVINEKKRCRKLLNNAPGISNPNA